MGVDGTATPEQIIEAVEKAGYGASMKGTEKLKEVRDEDFLKDKITPVLKKRLIASLLSCATVVFIYGP